MTLDVERTLRGGLDRLRTSAGLALAGVLFVVHPPTTVFPIEGLAPGPRLTSLLQQPNVLLGVVVENPANLLAVLVGTLVLLSIVVGVTVVTLLTVLVAIRTFAADVTGELQRNHLTRDLPWAFVNILAGSILYTVFVAVGLAALVAPGVYLAVSLAFWPAFVAVEGDSVVTAFRRSWRLADGSRWSILGLGFATLVVVATFAGVGDLLGGGVLGAAGRALGWTFAIGALVEAYREQTDYQVADSARPGQTT